MTRSGLRGGRAAKSCYTCSNKSCKSTKLKQILKSHTNTNMNPLRPVTVVVQRMFVKTQEGGNTDKDKDTDTDTNTDMDTDTDTDTDAGINYMPHPSHPPDHEVLIS